MLLFLVHLGERQMGWLGLDRVRMGPILLVESDLRQSRLSFVAMADGLHTDADSSLSTLAAAPASFMSASQLA